MSKKLTQLTEVTSLADGTLIYAVDTTRAAGDRSVGIKEEEFLEAESGTGTVITLSPKGSFFNTATPLTDTTYTITGDTTIVGAWGRTRIDSATATEPVVTGATKEGGNEWSSGTEFDLYIQVDDEGAKYFFDNTAVSATGGTNPLNYPVENEYPDITALLADQGNQTQDFFQYVVDASADPEVTSGDAYYQKLAGSTATLATDYRLLTSEEELVVTGNNAYRLFKLSDIQDDASPLSSVNNNSIGVEYDTGTGKVTGVFFNKIFSQTIVNFEALKGSLTYYVKIYNRTTRIFQVAQITAWATVNTDYLLASVANTITASDLTVNDRLEIFLDIDVAGGGGTVAEDTGTTITFTEDTFWNNLTYLTAGNLTLDLTGAVVGTAAWVWCDRYVPTLSGETFLLSGTPSALKLNVYKMVYTGVQTDDYDIDIVVDNKIYLSTPNITLTENVADEITLSNYAVGGADTYSILFNTVENEYANEAAMLADQVSQTTGQLNLLTDTGIYYEKLAASTADISDYTQISSTEIGTAATATTPAYNGTDLTYTHTGRTVGVRFLYFVNAQGNGFLDGYYGLAEGTSAAGFTFMAQSPDNFVQLPLVSTGTYNFTIYIDDVAGNTITVWNEANTDINLGDTAAHKIELRGVVTGWAYDNLGDKTYIYDVSNWGALQLGIGDGSINGFFNGCSNLTVSATDILDLNTTTMREAFQTTTVLADIPSIGSWDFTAVTSMQACFKNSGVSASGLNDINVSNVTSFRETFDNADSMTASLASWNVSSGVDFFEMFRNSSGANPDPTLWDTSSGTDFTNLVQAVSGSYDRDLSGWDVTGATGVTLILCSTPTISTANMDATLISWAAQAVNSSVTFKYGTSSTVTGTAADSGTTDGTTANRLIQSGQNFNTTVQIGDAVFNSTDTTYALVTNIVSDTELALNADIMVSGEAYTIYNNAAAIAVAKLASTYSWTVTFGGFV